MKVRTAFLLGGLALAGCIDRPPTQAEVAAAAARRYCTETAATYEQGIACLDAVECIYQTSLCPGGTHGR